MPIIAVVVPALQIPTTQQRLAGLVGGEVTLPGVSELMDEDLRESVADVDLVGHSRVLERAGAVHPGVAVAQLGFSAELDDQRRKRETGVGELDQRFTDGSLLIGGGIEDNEADEFGRRFVHGVENLLAGEVADEGNGGEGEAECGVHENTVRVAGSGLSEIWIGLGWSNANRCPRADGTREKTGVYQGLCLSNRLPTRPRHRAGMASRQYGRDMRFRVLGPLGVRAGDEWLGLGGPKQRLVLAVLLIADGRAVSTSALIDALWPESPPQTARKTIQGYVHHLRVQVGDRLATVGNGYQLLRDGCVVDADEFDGRVGEAKDLLDVDPRRAGELLGEALEMWEGTPLSDLDFEPALMSTITRLDEARLDAVADRIDADLALGGHHELVGEITSLAREYPLRERFRAQLMLALYRAGRQGEALRVYERGRRILADELGIDPSAELRELEGRILAKDPDLAGPASDPEAAPRAIRGYELREVISSDGARTIHRAYQRSVGREVAVVVIGSTVANDPTFIARFHADTERLAQVDHPNLLYVQDTWREPDRAYQVLRWVDGQSLRELLDDEQPLGTLAATRILEQVGGALAAAHRGGVIHGSLNAEAVRISRDRDAYLAGFAIGSPVLDEAPAADIRALARLASELVGDRLDDCERVLAAAQDDGYPRVEDLLRALRQATASDSAGLAHTDALPRTELRNPFKGLQAFQQADADDFFGREELIDRLVGMVRNQRLVAVVGPSGSGKSSLVKAGLAARLHASKDRYLVAHMFPGAFPFEELGSAIQRVAVRQIPIFDELARDDRGLSRATKLVLPDDDSDFVLVIDQFEELFSMVESEKNRQLFLDNICSAVQDPGSRLRIVLTMRADFFDRPLEYPEFGSLLEAGLVPLSVPGADGLARAISQPARRVGLELEPGLVPEIVRDVGDQPGGLPLLQFALTELFRRRDADQLTLDSYLATGGVIGALGRRAEELYADLPPAGQSAIQQAFLRLVTVDEGSDDLRRRASRSELNTLDVDRAALDEALRLYGASRLLTFDLDPITRGPTVEVAHEALIREWSRLREWVDHQREDLVLRRRLDAARQEWKQADERDSFLLREGRLQQFEEWTEQSDLVLTTEEHAYLEVSRDREDARERRSARVRRYILIGISAAAVVSLVLAAAALRFADQADRERAAAERSVTLAQAREYAAASAVVREIDPEAALAMAVRSMELFGEAGADRASSAVQALYSAVAGRTTVHWLQRQVVEAKYLDEGRMIGILERDAPLGSDSIELFDLTADALTLSHAIEFDRPVTGFTRLGDGQLLVTHRLSPNITVHDLATGENTEIDIAGFGSAADPIYAPGAALMTIRSPLPPYRLAVLDITTWELVNQATGRHGVASDAHGRMIVGVSEDSAEMVIDGEAGTTIVVPIDEGIVTGLAVSPDGTSVALAVTTSAFAGSLVVYDNSGEERWRRSGIGTSTLVWSFDSEGLYVGEDRGRVSLHRAGDGSVARTFLSLGGEVVDLSIEPTSGDLLATLEPIEGAGSGLAVLARSTGANNAGDLLASADVLDGVYLPDGGFVARLIDGRLEAFDEEGRPGPLSRALSSTEVAGLMYARDAELLVVPGTDGWTVVDPATLEIVQSETSRNEYTAFNVSPDGRQMIIGLVTDFNDDLSEFTVEDRISGDAILLSEGLSEGNAGAFDSTGTTVAAAKQNQIQLVELATSVRAATLVSAFVISIQFSPDDEAVVVGTEAGVVVYPIERENGGIGFGEPIWHRDRTEDSFGLPVPGTTHVLVVPVNQSHVELWDWVADETVWRLDLPSRGRGLSVVVSPDGERFAIMVGNQVWQYYIDPDDLLAGIADTVEPLTTEDCLAYLGRPDC